MKKYVSTFSWFGRSKLTSSKFGKKISYSNRSYKGKKITYVDGVSRKGGYGSNIRVFNTGKNYLVSILKDKIVSKGFYNKSTNQYYRSEKGFIGLGKVFKTRKGLNSFMNKYFK